MCSHLPQRLSCVILNSLSSESFFPTSGDYIITAFVCLEYSSARPACITLLRAFHGPAALTCSHNAQVPRHQTDSSSGRSLRQAVNQGTPGSHCEPSYHCVSSRHIRGSPACPPLNPGPHHQLLIHPKAHSQWNQQSLCCHLTPAAPSTDTPKTWPGCAQEGLPCTSCPPPRVGAAFFETPRSPGLAAGVPVREELPPEADTAPTRGRAPVDAHPSGHTPATPTTRPCTHALLHPRMLPHCCKEATAALTTTDSALSHAAANRSYCSPLSPAWTCACLDTPSPDASEIRTHCARRPHARRASQSC